MAKQKNNMIMRSTRGMIGKQIVFKRRAGKSYVAAPPETSENRVPTERQQAVQLKFKSSIAYASAAVKNAGLKKAYKAKALRGQSEHNVAFQDAFTSPEILGIITQGYHGKPGNLIVVQAQDDFRVNAVHVSIQNSDNELIEEGSAIANADGISWNYVTTESNTDIGGSRIKATAIDLPGNEGSLEVTL